MIENLFLCVGAQKAGTTWLYTQLDNHPEIAFSDVKEIHYFNTIHNGSLLLSSRKVEHLKRLINNNKTALERYFTNLSRGMELDPGIQKLLGPVDDQWYINAFQSRGKKYCADFSPEYALLPKAGFDNVKMVSKNQKIIYLMRDPLSRSKSAIQYFFQTQGIDPKDINSKMIDDASKKDFIINLSSYHKTIRALKSEFQENALKFMFFEDIMRDKEAAIGEVCRFLEIATPSVKQEKLEQRINTSKSIEFTQDFDDRMMEVLAPVYEFMRTEFSHLPQQWRAK